MTEEQRHILALCGGVGGAKLALGLSHILEPGDLTIVANTGDDFEHLGFHISPDVDTVMYTLGGLANPATGWGRDGESWSFMESLRAFGGDDWFLLGDKDLATHVERSRRLHAGVPLSEITKTLCKKVGIAHIVTPMTDDTVRTIIETPHGPLAFQHYFVRDKCEPVVTGFQIQGAPTASPSAPFRKALNHPELSAIVLCPSNPFVSIDPILSLSGVRAALDKTDVPVIAVSPIVGGQAIKGPAAKMMAELGLEVTSRSVAQHYASFLDGIVIHTDDAAEEQSLQTVCPHVLVTNTIMKTLDDKKRLANDVLAFAETI